MNRDLLIGGLSGIISRTTTAPLELWKIQQQNYSTYLSIDMNHGR